jgi:MFS transporter, OFA family, oxalate/formate antiporter
MDQPADSSEQAATEEAHSRPVSRVYYGWVMLPLSMVALVASSPGQTFGISIFNEPMRLSLDLTHGQLAWAYTLGTLFGAVPIAYIGHLMDRHGLRRTMLGVVTLFALACLATSRAHDWLTLTASFCLLRMLGPGALGFLSGNTLAFWFERRLGTVEGLRQLGMALAMAVIPLLNLWLVERWGWHGAYALLGIGLWLAIFPTFFLFFRNRPDELGQAIDGAHLPPTAVHSAVSSIDESGLTLAEALRTRSFWIMTTGTALFGLILTAVFFCLAPIFQERGLSEQHAAATLMVYAIALAAMQLAGGMLADRLPAPPLLALGVAGLALGAVVLHLAMTVIVAQIACGLLGASQGLFFGATQPLWARYFGRRHMGEIRGVLMTINVASSSLGPLIAGVTKDHFGEFDFAMIAFALAPLPVAVLSLFATPPERTSAVCGVEALEFAGSEVAYDRAG